MSVEEVESEREGAETDVAVSNALDDAFIDNAQRERVRSQMEDASKSVESTGEEQEDVVMKDAFRESKSKAKVLDDYEEVGSMGSEFFSGKSVKLESTRSREEEQDDVAMRVTFTKSKSKARALAADEQTEDADLKLFSVQP